MKWCVPGLPGGAASDHTNQVVSPRVAANDAAPPAVVMPRHLSLT